MLNLKTPSTYAIVSIESLIDKSLEFKASFCASFTTSIARDKSLYSLVTCFSFEFPFSNVPSALIGMNSLSIIAFADNECEDFLDSDEEMTVPPSLKIEILLMS